MGPEINYTPYKLQVSRKIPIYVYICVFENVQNNSIKNFSIGPNKMKNPLLQMKKNIGNRKADRYYQIMAINEEEEEKKSCLTLPVTGAGSTTVNKWVNLVCTVGQECKTAEGHKEGKRSGCKNPIKQCDHGSELNKCCVDPDLGTPEKISNILN